MLVRNTQRQEIPETSDRSASSTDVLVRTFQDGQLDGRIATEQELPEHPDHSLRWLNVLRAGLGHRPLLLEASTADASMVGRLPLCVVHSRLFGRFLVSLPYISSAGLQSETPEAGSALIDRAAQLAEELDCRHLELRHESPFKHVALTASVTSKVHMRLELPLTSDELWTGLKAKVRNQVRKGRQQNFTVHWGSSELLDEFYAVFSRNMRDLGTPVFGLRLFSAIFESFGARAELCVVRDGATPIASALLIHGSSVTEVPSAGALRAWRSRNPNMLLYWELLARTVQRGQQSFDFGRSTVDSPTYRFKKQWGAKPEPANWQYFVRHGTVGDMRPDNPKYRLMIRVWQQLPLWCANQFGPRIVRGIP